MTVLATFELDHMQHGVDQRKVSERLRKVAEMLSGVRVDLLGAQQQRTGEGQQLGAQLAGRWYSPISHSAETSQNEQMVKLPSSPVNPSSVSSTL